MKIFFMTHIFGSKSFFWPKVRGVFLDITKVFDKVLHKGLIYKLKQNIQLKAK